MLVDILGAAFAIGSLLFVNIPDVPRTGERPHPVEDFKQGFATLFANKPLMAAALPLVLSTMVYMPLGALYPLLVRVHFRAARGTTASWSCSFPRGWWFRR